MTDQNNGTAGDPKPEAPKPEVAPDKIDRLADDAVAAGSRITETETGRKAAEFADDVFDKGEELTRKALDSETGRKVTAKAGELGSKALDTEVGRKVAETAENLGNSEAGQTAKKVWNTPVGRNVGTGAAAGAALGLVIPIVGPLFGAVVGGGLGYLRTLAGKSKKS